MALATTFSFGRCITAVLYMAPAESFLFITCDMYSVIKCICFEFVLLLYRTAFIELHVFGSLVLGVAASNVDMRTLRFQSYFCTVMMLGIFGVVFVARVFGLCLLLLISPTFKNMLTSVELTTAENETFLSFFVRVFYYINVPNIYQGSFTMFCSSLRIRSAARMSAVRIPQNNDIT